LTARVPLTTQRLRLVPTAPEHAQAIWTAVEASLPELRPWLYWAKDNTLEDKKLFTERCRAQWGRSEWTFSIFAADDLIGCIGLDTYQPLLRSAQLGYWLRSDRAGRGYMTEAGRAVVDFAFDELKLHRIELHSDTRNAASIRVAEKLGFTRVGTLRDGERGIDGWHDCYVFDLLARDREKHDSVTPSERTRVGRRP
jgi:ribosomal-protein-serine acetyltransferase